MRIFKTPVSECVVILGVALVTPLQVFAQNGPTNQPATKLDLTAVAKSDVVKAEAELAKTSARVQQYAASQTELSQAKIHLAEARLQLAQLQNQPEVVSQQAQIVVDERTQIVSYISAVYKAGGTSLSELNAARLALAEARVDLELYAFIDIKRENETLALTRYKAGTASQDEVKQASQPAELGRIQSLLSTEQNTGKQQKR